MKPSPSSKPEFSRVFPVDKLRDHPARERIEANDKERVALAARLNLVELKNLEAELNLLRVSSGDMVEVSGQLTARVVQTCVVTLEAFESPVKEEFKTYFSRKPPAQEEADVPLEDERAPEPIPANGEIDLGELVTQHLSLALDPHPRKPGAVFKPADEGAEGAEEKRNPFAVLADFRADKGKGKK